MSDSTRDGSISEITFKVEARTASCNMTCLISVHGVETTQKNKLTTYYLDLVYCRLMARACCVFDWPGADLGSSNCGLSQDGHIR